MRNHKFDGAVDALTPEQLEEAVAMYLAANPDAVSTGDAEGEEKTDPVEQVRQNADRRDADISAVGQEEIPGMHNEIKTLLAEIDKLKGAGDMNADAESEDPDNPDKTDGDSSNGCDNPDKVDGDDTMDPAVDTQHKMDAADAEKTFGEMYSICQMAEKLNLDGFIPRSVNDGKKRIIAAINPKMKLDGKSAAYISGAYEIACQQVLNRKTTAEKMRKVIGEKNHMDGVTGESAASQARERMVGRLVNNGKGGNE